MLRCILLFFFLFGAGCAGVNERLYYAAPSLLPGTDIRMRTPGYWISRHAYPDKLILGEKEIALLNGRIEKELGLTSDICAYPRQYSGDALRSTLNNTLNDLRRGVFYLADGSQAPESFYLRLRDKMGIADIPESIDTRFAFVAHNADQRVFPVQEGLYKQSGDADFDELQNSSLGVGTPLAVLLGSKDGKWSYVVSCASSGWVQTDKIAFCGIEDIKRLTRSAEFVVITKAKADIFLDPALSEYYDFSRMGERFALKPATNGSGPQVFLTCRAPDGSLSLKNGYLRSQDVHRGYLPYTARNTIQQAFESLNTPYGWGGMYGESDCSQFVKEVFATVGVNLPRNSSAQANVGRLLCDFTKGNVDSADKLSFILEKAGGGSSLLCLNGHIMLFLGIEDNKPFVIHDVWGYRIKGKDGKDAVRLINRVAVTGLDLGEGSRKGSFLQRIRLLRDIDI